MTAISRVNVTQFPKYSHEALIPTVPSCHILRLPKTQKYGTGYGKEISLISNAVLEEPMSYSLPVKLDQ